ncbi:MAG: hypothetical protein WKF73_11240 [Nocardioidaceae bacterium]
MTTPERNGHSLPRSIPLRLIYLDERVTRYREQVLRRGGHQASPVRGCSHGP